MKTVAIEVGVAQHIFAHQICSMRFDNALKKIEICMANRSEFVLANATADGYRDIVSKIVASINSPQGVIITGINQPAAPAVEEPVSKEPLLCGSCGDAPATVDGLCDECNEQLSNTPQSFEGPEA